MIHSSQIGAATGWLYGNQGRLLLLGSVVVVAAAMFVLPECSSAPGTFSSAGTAVSFDGQVCGQDASFRLTDMKDRSQATASVTCPQGGSIEISTADSSTSAVLAQQIELIGKLTDMVTRLAGQAAPL